MRTRRDLLRAGVVLLGGMVAGCSSEGGTTSTPSFGLSNLVFAESEPSGYMDYEEQPDASYAPDDVIWIYFNVDGVSYEENDDGTSEIWIAEQLTVTSPAGETLLDQEVVNTHQNLPEDRDPSKLYLANNVTLPSGAETGDYDVDIEVEDKLAERTATISSSFTVA